MGSKKAGLEFHLGALRMAGLRGLLIMDISYRTPIRETLSGVMSPVMSS